MYLPVGGTDRGRLFLPAKGSQLVPLLSLKPENEGERDIRHRPAQSPQAGVFVWYFTMPYMCGTDSPNQMHSVLKRSALVRSPLSMLCSRFGS